MPEIVFEIGVPLVLLQPWPPLKHSASSLSAYVQVEE